MFFLFNFYIMNCEGVRILQQLFIIEKELNWDQITEFKAKNQISGNTKKALPTFE